MVTIYTHASLRDDSGEICEDALQAMPWEDASLLVCPSHYERLARIYSFNGNEIAVTVCAGVCMIGAMVSVPVILLTGVASLIVRDNIVIGHQVLIPSIGGLALFGTVICLSCHYEEKAAITECKREALGWPCEGDLSGAQPPMLLQMIDAVKKLPERCADGLRHAEIFFSTGRTSR